MAKKLSGPEKKERQLQKLLARIAENHALREKEDELKSTPRRTK
jgi:hypothetical protein